MNEIKKVVQIDIVSLKPYFTIKNLLVLLALCVLIYFVSDNPFIVISLPLLFAIMYSSYPFLVGGQAGLEALYRIFGIKSKNVVIGRYVLSILLFIVASLLSLLIYLVFFIPGQSHFPTSLIGLSAYWRNLFLIYLLILSFQYPLYFKLGYQKAKTFVFIGVFLFGALAGALNPWFLEISRFIANHKAIALVITLFVVTAIIATPISISIRVYKNKDF